jgi:hypothetical protein
MGFDGFEALSLKKRKRDQAKKARQKVDEQRKLQARLLYLAEQRALADSSRLDCTGCHKEKSVVGVDIGRFPIVAQVAGVIISLLSILGIGAALLSLLLGGAKILYCLIGLAASTAVGLLGWLLLLRKKVLICESCGYVYG